MLSMVRSYGEPVEPFHSGLTLSEVEGVKVMQDFLFMWIVISGLLFLLTIYFAIVSASRYDKFRQLEMEHQKMVRSFNELDEQAKLIVKTDLELNKAEEELDKRLHGLNTLQRTSRQISQALNEEEIFEKLKASLFEELGFSKTLVVVHNGDHTPKARISIGFEPDKVSKIIENLFEDEHLKNAMSQGHAFSSINALRKTKEKLVQIFETEHFVLAPLVTQDGALGFVFVGNRYDASAVTEGDEELMTILTGQIGQAIDNAQLFEKVFRSSQELEVKVKERTKQLATALAQVEEINRKKSEFISAVSHELRTPLTSIKGYAAILMAGKVGNIPELVKERLAKINTHSDNLVNLINNLLDIARIESGRVEMKCELHKTRMVIDNSVDLLTPQATAKEIKITITVAPPTSEIYIDLSQAERILINLLSNAIKFTPKGGTIQIGSLPVLENGFAIFEVKDSGIGIAPADLERLFSEFFRAENEINQTARGTGLGLVLAKNIVAAHHGKIWVKSQLGSGTTFSFTLPTSKEAFERSKTGIVILKKENHA